MKEVFWSVMMRDEKGRPTTQTAWIDNVTLLAVMRPQPVRAPSGWSVSISMPNWIAEIPGIDESDFSDENWERAKQAALKAAKEHLTEEFAAVQAKFNVRMSALNTLTKD